MWNITRKNLPEQTAQLLVNMALQVEQQSFEEEKEKKINNLKDKVLSILDLPKNASVEEIRLLWVVKLKIEDIMNIESEEVLEELLRLNKENETNI